MTPALEVEYVEVTPVHLDETPIIAAPITWTVELGDGSLSQAVSITDQDGRARTEWTLGPTPGTQLVKAATPASGNDPRSDFEVTFVATASNRALRIAGGDAQTDTVGARLAPLSVEYVDLVDPSGGAIPIAGAAINWSVLSGGGSVQPNVSTTDNAGRASATWTLGRTVGRQTLRASAPGAGDPASAPHVDFQAEALLVIDSVVVTPPQSTLNAVGATRQLTSTAYFNQQPVPGLTFDWRSLNEVIATVSPADGLVTARAAGGPIGIVAMERSSRKADTAFVTVAAGPPPPPPAPRLAYALLDAASIAAGAANPSFAFNSATGVITVQTTGPGRYEVTFPSQETPVGGATAVLVSSFGQGTSWCKLDTWRNGPSRSLVASVVCFERASPAASEFTILLLGDRMLPHRFAFALGDRPGSATYAPPDSASYSSSGQPITIERNSTGVYRVGFPGLERSASGAAEIVLLTAAGPQAVRCGLHTDDEPLRGAIAPVACVEAATLALTNADARFVAAVIDKGRPGLRWASAYTGGMEEEEGTNPITQSQSSSGGAVTQTKRGAGRYDITFAGLARGPGTTEGVQITSASGRGDYCKLLGSQNSGPDLVVQVQCYAADSLDFEDQDFTILIIQ